MAWIDRDKVEMQDSRRVQAHHREADRTVLLCGRHPEPPLVLQFCQMVDSDRGKRLKYVPIGRCPEAAIRH